MHKVFYLQLWRGGSLYFSRLASKRGTKNHRFLVKTSPRLHSPEQDQGQQVATTPRCGSVTARVTGDTAKRKGNDSYTHGVAMKRHTLAISTLLMRRGQLIPLSGGARRRLGPWAGELWGWKHVPRDAALLQEQRRDRTNPGECPKPPSRLAGGWTASRCKGQTYKKKVFRKG